MIKLYGTHLKASAAMVRLRVYDVLALLPAESFEGENHFDVWNLRHCVHRLLSVHFSPVIQDLGHRVV